MYPGRGRVEGGGVTLRERYEVGWFRGGEGKPDYRWCFHKEVHRLKFIDLRPPQKPVLLYNDLKI